MMDDGSDFIWVNRSNFGKELAAANASMRPTPNWEE